MLWGMGDFKKMWIQFYNKTLEVTASIKEKKSMQSNLFFFFFEYNFLNEIWTHDNIIKCLCTCDMIRTHSHNLLHLPF